MNTNNITITELNAIIKKFESKMRETFPHNRETICPKVVYGNDNVEAIYYLKDSTIRAIKMIVSIMEYEYTSITIDVYYTKDCANWFTQFKNETIIEKAIREEFTNWKITAMVNDPD